MEPSDKHNAVEMETSEKHNGVELGPSDKHSTVEMEPSDKHNAVEIEPSNNQNTVNMEPSNDQQRVQLADAEPTRSQPTVPPPEEDKAPERGENTESLEAQGSRTRNLTSREYFRKKYKEAWRTWDKRTIACVRDGVKWLNFIQHVCKKETDLQKCLLDRQQMPGPKSERTQQMEEVLGNLCSVEQNLLEALDHTGPFIDFLDQAHRRILRMATLSWKMTHGEDSRGKEDGDEGRDNAKEETVRKVESVSEECECDPSQRAVSGRCSPLEPDS